jgi:hypothetical protein
LPKDAFGGPREPIKSWPDFLHVAIVPIILGSGIRLWDHQRGLEGRLPSIESETAGSSPLHLTFAR